MGTAFRANIFNGVTVASTGAVTSTALDISNSTGDFSIALIMTGTGAAATVTYSVSQDGTNYDTTTTSPTRTILTGLGTAYIVKGFNVPLAKWLKITVTGTGANPADATVTGTIMYDEG